MLTSTFLSYRQLDFQIYRLLESADASNIDIWLQIAEEIFGTILHVGSFRDRAWYTNFDFEFLVRLSFTGVNVCGLKESRCWCMAYLVL